ncbi:hypothetical protein Tco_1165182 [Tanacetum coccineum]
MDLKHRRQIDLDALLARRLIRFLQKRFNRRKEQYSRGKKQSFLHDTNRCPKEFLQNKEVLNAITEEEKKDESVHEEVQEEEGAKKRKLGTRRKLKAKRRKLPSSSHKRNDDLKYAYI